MMLRLILIVMLACLADPRPVVAQTRLGPVKACSVEGTQCRVLDEAWTVREGPDLVFTRSVTLNGPPGPLAVRLLAMGSSEVRWNGALIGRNGSPGAGPAVETPGRFRAVFPVPPELLRQGENVVSIRLTSHHLWLPVRHPLHEFSVGPPDDLTARELRAYAPGLAVGGVLLFVAVGFGLVHIMDQSQRGALLLAAMAAVAAAQLAVEAARAFVPYPYPWQLARIVLIALLAGATATMMARYAAWRFIPARRGLVTGLAATGVVISLILGPGFDAKALGCLAVGIAAVTVCAIVGARRGRTSAWVALGMAILAGVMTLAQGGGFLDSGYYLALTLVFAALMIEQFRLIRGDAHARAPAVSPVEPLRGDLMRVSDGRRVHLLPMADVAWLKAADDYCEVGLVDGRVLLNGATLAATLDAAPEGLVRVHRSHAVNRAHVTGAFTKPGGARILALGRAGSAPVGRTYRAAAASLLGEA